MAQIYRAWRAVESLLWRRLRPASGRVPDPQGAGAAGSRILLKGTQALW
jgi:hypothetical protein